jgi:tetratricopeptide (TPR) repeat protein
VPVEATEALDRERRLVEDAAFVTGDFDRAEEALNAALRAAEEAGDSASTGAALDQLAFLLHWRNLGRPDPDWDAELELFERALAVRRDAGDRAGVAESLFHVGLAHQLRRRDGETAEPIFAEALALADEVGDRLTQSYLHRHIGFLRMVQGELDQALTHLRRSLELREVLGWTRGVAAALQALGECELDAGHHVQARAHLERSVELAESFGTRPWLLDSARADLARVPSGRD